MKVFSSWQSFYYRKLAEECQRCVQKTYNFLLAQYSARSEERKTKRRYRRWFFTSSLHSVDFLLLLYGLTLLTVKLRISKDNVFAIYRFLHIKAGVMKIFFIADSHKTKSPLWGVFGFGWWLAKPSFEDLMEFVMNFPCSQTLYRETETVSEATVESTREFHSLTCSSLFTQRTGRGMQIINFN